MMQQILLSFGGSATTSSSLQYTDDMFSTFLYDGQFSNLEVIITLILVMMVV